MMNPSGRRWRHCPYRPQCSGAGALSAEEPEYAGSVLPELL